MACCHKHPHKKTWADEKFGCTQADGRRHIRFGRIKIAYALKVEHDYREDLARSQVEIAADPNRPRNWKPGMKDPEAYVDGPVGVKKLLDKRKREGWVVDKDKFDRAATGFTDADIKDEDLMQKAYEMAAAEGFQYDEDE